MANGIRMKVMTQIAGNHDPRILVGSNSTGGFSWGGGEEIVVTEELAANFETTKGRGYPIAERIQEQRQTAALKTPETTMLPKAEPRIKGKPGNQNSTGPFGAETPIPPTNNADTPAIKNLGEKLPARNPSLERF
jgi:hypothetical protein